MIAELRYVVRSLARERGFALGVIATFAVAIGATAAMFGLVNRLMLSPPPGVEDARQVMRVRLAYGEPSGERYTVTTTSYPVFETVEGVESITARSKDAPDPLELGEVRVRRSLELGGHAADLGCLRADAAGMAQQLQRLPPMPNLVVQHRLSGEILGACVHSQFLQLP